MILFLNAKDDFTIEDAKKHKYSIEKVKKLYEEGKVTDYNLAFGRLIRHFTQKVRQENELHGWQKTN